MRSLATIGLLGSFLLATGIQAQSLSEHAAAAAGATIGTAAGKPMSNAITKIFGQVDNDTKKAANQKTDIKPQPKTPAPTPNSSPALGITSPDQPLGSHASTQPRRRTTPEPVPQFRQTATASAPPAVPVVVVPIVVPEPPRKEPTPEELASVKVGATASEVLKVLGPPESRVTIPDDGHLLEICQYWAKGKQLGTVRLDNGQVITVETKTQN
ncbi:MAG TPA: hypothetical protein VEU96_32655 [Bryobacteraceae bacterium]|nr:hypothetical protein [Bryobacteraceae bacterium]